MKGILRTYIFHVISLWMLSDLLPEVVIIKGGHPTLFIGAVLLALFNVLLKPLLKLLFLPINALSLGLFSLVINAGVFYLFLKAMPQVSVVPWDFPGFSLYGVTVPALHLSFIVTLVAISLLQTGITNFFAFISR